MRSCHGYINEVKSERVTVIVRILEHVVQFFPSHFPSLILPILPNVLTNLLEEEVYMREMAVVRWP